MVIVVLVIGMRHIICPLVSLIGFVCIFVLLYLLRFFIQQLHLHLYLRNLLTCRAYISLLSALIQQIIIENIIVNAPAIISISSMKADMVWFVLRLMFYLSSVLIMSIFCIIDINSFNFPVTSHARRIRIK